MMITFEEGYETATFISENILAGEAREQLADRVFESFFRYLFDDPSIFHGQLQSDGEWSDLVGRCRAKEARVVE